MRSSPWSTILFIFSFAPSSKTPDALPVFLTFLRPRVLLTIPLASPYRFPLPLFLRVRAQSRGTHGAMGLHQSALVMDRANLAEMSPLGSAPTRPAQLAGVGSTGDLFNPWPCRALAHTTHRALAHSRHRALAHSRRLVAAKRSGLLGALFHPRVVAIIRALALAKTARSACHHPARDTGGCPSRGWNHPGGRQPRRVSGARRLGLWDTTLRALVRIAGACRVGATKRNQGQDPLRHCPHCW